MSTAVQATPHILQALAPDLGQQLAVVNYHWQDVKEDRQFRTRIDGGFYTQYRIKGTRTRQDCPGMLVIMDALERIYAGEKRYVENFANTTASQIAKDMVRCGTGGEPGDANTILPAVWISEAPDVPKTGEAYAEFQRLWTNRDECRKKFPAFMAEIERYERREYLWCETNLRAGDQFHAEGKPLEIRTKHRNSAIWMGADAVEHPWMDQTKFGTVKACPFCATPVPAAALRCSNPACGEILDYAKFEATKAALKGEAVAKK